MAENITAPLSGKIVSIFLEGGGKVEEDEEALVIETLKMENPIYVPCDGTVKEIKVAVGDTVYVTLGYGEPVTALDAATGEVIRRYRGTEGTREILVDGDTQQALLGLVAFCSRSVLTVVGIGEGSEDADDHDYNHQLHQCHAMHVLTHNNSPSDRNRRLFDAVLHP